jgi:hypothetical protein
LTGFITLIGFITLQELSSTQIKPKDVSYSGGGKKECRIMKKGIYIYYTTKQEGEFL